MNYREHGLVFDCEGDSLIGVVAVPDQPQDTGVLIIVGGPQYRIGSHRQFVLLARYLAQQGIACMRFDNRSMGDATGDARDFEDIDEDLSTAINAFVGAVPQVRNIVLWGLCGGASAACVYAPRDARVKGLILLNPWVRTLESQAKTYLKHYYIDRLRDPAFWKKLFTGKLGVVSALGGLLDTVRKSRPSKTNGGNGSNATLGNLLEKMLHGFAKSGCRGIVVLSGRDYVARECDEVMIPHPQFCALVAAGRASVERIAGADHTFTSRYMHEGLERLTVRCVAGLEQPFSPTNDLRRELVYADDCSE